jgi:hypothetical protein
MPQNTIASKIRHHSRLMVQSSSVGNRSLYPFTSSSSSLVIPSSEVRGSKKPSDPEATTPLSTVVKDVIGVKDIIMIPLPPTSSSLSFSISSIVNEVRGREERKTLVASDIEHLEDSVIVNIVVRMSPIFTDLQLPKVEDFDDLPLAVVEHLKKIEEAKEIAERCFITDIRKKNPLLHVMAELRISRNLMTLHLNFLQSYVLNMRKETREYVMERINNFDIGDDSKFDISSFKNLFRYANEMVLDVDEHNDKVVYFGIFRLYKRNLYRFWYRVGMTLRYNLDYHWKKTMREMCKMVEDEELKKAMKKAMVDNGQKQLEEGIEKLILMKKSNSSNKSNKSNKSNNSNKSKSNSSSNKKKWKKIYRMEEEEEPEEEVVEEKGEEEDDEPVEEKEEERSVTVVEKFVEIVEVVSHTCDFATQYVMESLENLVQQNQEMRRMMNETYFAILASPDTIFV